MKLFNTRKYPLTMQYLISTALVLIVSVICFNTTAFTGYKVVALVLLMTVSFLAMLFEIMPVLIAAVLSAIIWNFFFIPPLFTFHIDNTEDILMFLLYFLIALVNAVLTFKIRDAESKAREEADKEKTIKLYNNLLNSLSHELRTPVATILGAVDTLKENAEKLSKTQQADLLFEIDKASMRLNQQVENLLNMSRLESGMLKLKLDWCDINELVNAVIDKISVTGGQHLEYHTKDDLPYFKLDAGLIEQVLYNLVQNAVQYTPAGTIIKIAASHVGDQCIVIVSDNGKGVPESEMPLVFDKFYRLPSTKPGGSGLGLSIVKGFIEAHGGQVKLEKNPGGGARFILEIPAETSYLNNLKYE